MGLLLVVVATLDTTWLGWRELLKARGIDGVAFLVLPAMCHHFVGIGTHEVTFEAVEMGGLVLLLPCD